jgi:type 1 fimbriae regulatory protein FimB/type 1 fimbriae regulatory protein FimE
MPQTASAEENTHVSPRRRHLTPSEANRLIQAAGQRGRCRLRDKVLVRMTYRHGLRASEAVNMRWDHINLDDGTIHIRRRKMGNHSTHTMDRDERRDLRTMFKSRSGAFVFESERGGPLSHDMLTRIVREAGELAKLPVPVHPHMLRHAAGYMLINDGVDLRLVQDFLGHKDIKMTAHYTALVPGRLAAVRVR